MSSNALAISSISPPAECLRCRLSLAARRRSACALNSRTIVSVTAYFFGTRTHLIYCTVPSASRRSACAVNSRTVVGRILHFIGTRTSRVYSTSISASRHSGCRSCCSLVTASVYLYSEPLSHGLRRASYPCQGSLNKNSNSNILSIKPPLTRGGGPLANGERWRGLSRETYLSSLQSAATRK